MLVVLAIGIGEGGVDIVRAYGYIQTSYIYSVFNENVLD